MGPPHAWLDAPILNAWCGKVSADLCVRKGFRGGPILNIAGSQHLLNSSHVRERGKALLREVWVGGVWNGFLLQRVRGELVSCRFCGNTHGDGHEGAGILLFWSCIVFSLLSLVP